MSVFSKILAVFSMVCYLAMSSVAAAHAFPVMNGIGGADRIVLEASPSVAERVSQDQVVEIMIACHQDSNIPADAAKASGICKIFCSAIGHALLSTELAEVATKFHNTSPRFSVDSLTTRQLTVEQQPPK